MTAAANMQTTVHTFQFTYYYTENFFLHETEDKFLTDSERLLWKLVHKLQRHFVRIKRLRCCAG